MKVAVVIPVWNERPNLPACLSAARAALPAAEIIAVDGGSTDGSREWLAAAPGVRLVDSARGKGPQQNAGAAVTSGDVLLFLHADCELPDRAMAGLEAALANPRAAGGCFDVRFAERRPWSLHPFALGMNVRARLLRRSFGDQALFVRRSIFEQIGGFPNWPLFEDYELVRRFKRHGRFQVIPIPLTLSARRFQKYGVWRTLVRVLALQLGFYLGVSPQRLKRWFADVRPHTDRPAPRSLSGSSPSTRQP